MRFGVLGSLQVIAGDSAEPGTVSAARPRVLLAVLLWRANHPVPADELAELVWDGKPPDGAAGATRALVMRLRRQLDERVAARIVTRAPGYLIEVSGDELDASRFESLTRRAGAAVRAGRWADAARTASEALGLWRGAPLTDIPSQMLRDRWVPHLEQLRTQALDWRIEADLRRGRHEELIPELQDLAARHPLREHLHGQLMLALYRCGRQAEALDVYQHARRALIAELGVEPGPDLRDLHQRMLSGELRRAEPRRGTPRELPPAVPGFTGRSAELEALSRLLGRPGAGPGTIVISAIGGTAGVGKTALAVRWAHQVAGQFPDGQLYVNLRGYDPGQPVPAADALAGFLRSLGVPGPDVPAGEDERAARYRSLLAGRRVLVVLDNAGSSDQVRPLLPGTSGCAVVVTSRDALTGLVARDGAARLDLDVLPLADAVALLRALIGTRVEDEPGAAADLAAQCCRLPLALRVAGELAASQPTMPLSRLADELAGSQHRLDLLDGDGDQRSAVRAVFSWSCQRLSADAARTFRLAGLHPGADFDDYAIAALTAATLDQARGALGVLARAHLIQPLAPDRYAMHDLLRAYARELGEVSDGPDGQRAALTRLLDHYLHTASAAMNVLHPAESHRRPAPRPAGPMPSLADTAQARAWLDAAVANLVAAIAHAADHGWQGHATRLAGCVFRFLDSSGRYPEIVAISTSVLRAAGQAGDLAAEAEALNQLTIVGLRQGHYERAAGLARQSLARYEKTGDHLGQARALGYLGIVRFQQGDYRQAAGYQQRALAHYRETGDKAGESRAVNNFGMNLLRQGRYSQAADAFRRALALRPDGDIESLCMVNLGVVLLRQGSYQRAADTLTAALTVSRQAGSWSSEAYCLTNLGLVELRQGQCQQAAAHLRQALALTRQANSPSGMGDALSGLGEVSLAIGRPGQARTQYTAALGLTIGIGDRYEQAFAHRGLGRAYDAAGDPVQARHHWYEALAIYTDLDVPEASEVRALLSQGIGEVMGRVP